MDGKDFKEFEELCKRAIAQFSGSLRFGQESADPRIPQDYREEIMLEHWLAEQPPSEEFHALMARLTKPPE